VPRFLTEHSMNNDYKSAKNKTHDIGINS